MSGPSAEQVGLYDSPLLFLPLLTHILCKATTLDIIEFSKTLQNHRSFSIPALISFRNTRSFQIGYGLWQEPEWSIISSPNYLAAREPVQAPVQTNHYYRPSNARPREWIRPFYHFLSLKLNQAQAATPSLISKPKLHFRYAGFWMYKISFEFGPSTWMNLSNPLSGFSEIKGANGKFTDVT